jgi:hypothetical protein
VQHNIQPEVEFINYLWLQEKTGGGCTSPEDVSGEAERRMRGTNSVDAAGIAAGTDQGN